MTVSNDELLRMLRCPQCGSELSLDRQGAGNQAGVLSCAGCEQQFPVVDGIPRLLLSPLREALGNDGTRSGQTVEVATALSFGFEWSCFPEMYEEWYSTFFAYMQPRGPEFFNGKTVLDAGCGSGRFAYQAARCGAQVWAIDLGPAVEVANRNTAGAAVSIVQADLRAPPFAAESFDFVYSLGVLHHLPEPEIAFHKLLDLLKPGGEIQIYLYWKPEGQPLKRALLALVSAVRKLTTRLPHRMIYTLSYSAAALTFLFFVWPHSALRKVPGLKGMAELLPMKQYSRFPFRVCVNDQFDRFSAPIENRYTRTEVMGWLLRAGLEQPEVRPNYGWLGSGRKALVPVAEKLVSGGRS